MGNWEKLPMAVGAIDGTSTEIYRPLVEPQELYYSGHRHFHCVHTQVVIDNLGKICYIDAGFVGHQNDAQQFAMMRSIGRNAELDFPEGIVLLADKIYPNRYPLMTPYTRQQIQRKPDNLKRRCRKINNLIKEYRVTVEHSIGELKNYRVMLLYAGVTTWEKYVITGNLRNVDCLSERYQPFRLWSNVSGECLYVKSPCEGEGQVVLNNGSLIEDRTCRCDYTKGYMYIKQPKQNCSCNPSEEDCSCYITKCPHGSILSQGIL
ncbi:unnamed protein product [Mytilus edulis]|uniref:DDE Tnp4 domain-containing protein n=1 Tax=Mytilus edulis TaxID=6550 RepID=A0A8S3VKE6_MYTED|nr:unnamed protein product [Mytilus edulis]